MLESHKMHWQDVVICVREQTRDNYVDQKILNQSWRLITHVQSKTFQATDLSASNTITWYREKYSLQMLSMLLCRITLRAGLGLQQPSV